jgi:hypothetical protein
MAAITIGVPLALANVAWGEPGSQQVEEDPRDTVAPKYSEPSPTPSSLSGDATMSPAVHGAADTAEVGVGVAVGASSANQGTDDGATLASSGAERLAARPARREGPLASSDVVTAAAVSTAPTTAVAAMPSLLRRGPMDASRGFLAISSTPYTRRQPGRCHPTSALPRK